MKVCVKVNVCKCKYDSGNACTILRDLGILKPLYVCYCSHSCEKPLSESWLRSLSPNFLSFRHCLKVMPSSVIVHCRYENWLNYKCLMNSSLHIPHMATSPTVCVYC